MRQAFFLGNTDNTGALRAVAGPFESATAAAAASASLNLARCEAGEALAPDIYYTQADSHALRVLPLLPRPPGQSECKESPRRFLCGCRTGAGSAPRRTPLRRVPYAARG